MADIYHTFLDDEQEAEYHFRKAHGADKCAVCGGEGGKRYSSYGAAVPSHVAYEAWDECEACDGLGYERVQAYIVSSPWRDDYSMVDIKAGNEGESYYKNSASYTLVDQHVLMDILQRFAPKAYVIECKRQGVTP